MSFGARLRQRRLAAGKSLAQLASEVHYSKGYLSKVETGRRAPSPDLAMRCDAALGAEGALALLVPSVSAGMSAPQPTSTGDQWILAMDRSGRGSFGAMPRREMLAIGTMSLLTWAVAPRRLPAREEPGQLDAFRAVFDEMRRLGQVATPGVLLPMLIGQTHAMKILATSARPPARAKALQLASRFAEFTGWIAQEAGNDDAALWWTDHALQLAAAGGDHELAAYVLVRRGLVAMYQSDARQTVALAKRAQAAGCSPRTRGLAALREAQGHALAGSYRDCRHSLDRAAIVLEAATVDQDRPILGTTNTADPVAMVTGWCMYDLGRPRQAAEILDREFSSVPRHGHRSLARIGARYALALVASGEVDHGCVVADNTLDALTLTDSATVRTDLRRLSHELRRWGANRGVRDLTPRLLDALSAPGR
jgi:transcriptional regulator with XRE-family HTH domain